MGFSLKSNFKKLKEIGRQDWNNPEEELFDIICHYLASLCTGSTEKHSSISGLKRIRDKLSLTCSRPRMLHIRP